MNHALKIDKKAQDPELGCDCGQPMRGKIEPLSREELLRNRVNLGLSLSKAFLRY
ncbi:hypothetical protein LguiA_013723 [Lonicera macranthoides]